jgi:hypothetical protein
MGDVLLAAGAHLPLVGRLAEGERLLHTLDVSRLEICGQSDQKRLELRCLAGWRFVILRWRPACSNPIPPLGDIDYRR